jgi:polyisoprenoid-binding protein YceI
VKTLSLCLALLCLVAGAHPVSAQATFRIDRAQSRITYSMIHPAHRWTGTSNRVSGTLTVQGGRVTAGRLSAPIVSFDSGNRSRDSNMASDTEAYLYPNVTFVALSVTPGSGNAATVRGTLTFHGVARPVTVPSTIEVSGNRVHLRGEFETTLTEFGIEQPSLMMVKTRDWIGLSFDLVAAS